MTALPAVNAIPHVCAAAPGIVTYLDVPLVAPKGWVPMKFGPGARRRALAVLGRVRSRVGRATRRTSTSWRDGHRLTPTRAPRTPDGRWDGRAGGDRRVHDAHRRVPADRSRAANGTAIVEWLNVTGGLDVPALWMPTHRHLVREGYTWVGVSVQQVEHRGRRHDARARPARRPRPSATTRCSIPATRTPTTSSPRSAARVRASFADRYGLPHRRVLAAGASQSAFHLTTYVNAIDPRDAVFDGFLLAGPRRRGRADRGLGPAQLGNGPEAMARAACPLGGPRPHSRRRARSGDGRAERNRRVRRRSATSRPANPTAPGSACGKSPVPRTATRISCPRPRSIPARSRSRSSRSLIARADGRACRLQLPMNSGPQMHFVLQRAVDALDEWVRDGTAPPSAPRLEVTTPKTASARRAGRRARRHAHAVGRRAGGGACPGSASRAT